MTSFTRLLTVLLLPLLWITPAMAGPISISAAASLKEVLNELAGDFARSHQGVRIAANHGGSGQLALQIESGVTADIFIPANLEWMDYLKKKGLITGSIRNFTYNTLVFAGAAGKAASLHDLLKLERIAIGSPKSVPAGDYAVQALQNSGLYRHLAPKLVPAKDVREALRYAGIGEVDGAFVYRTDALQAKKVRILFTVPQTLYPRVAYPMALTAEGSRNPDAAAFLQYLESKEAKRILKNHGFADR